MLDDILQEKVKQKAEWILKNERNKKQEADCKLQEKSSNYDKISKKTDSKYMLVKDGRTR